MFDFTRGANRSAQRHPVRKAFALLAILLALLTPNLVAAQSPNNPSGLPLPRFVSIRSEPTNVRVGPGTKYEIAWTYLKSGVPVEIVQEFDTWRKIRDLDGEEGWVQQSLLIGSRAGYVTPVMANTPTVLRADQSDTSDVRAQLGPGLRVQLRSCDGTWCEVSATSVVESGRGSTYSGFIHQEELWGVYPDEVFD